MSTFDYQQHVEEFIPEWWNDGRVDPLGGRYTWEIRHVSDCCNVILDPLHVDHEMCPDCGEHCIPQEQEYPVRRSV